jgi:Flp pilus assembly protein TadG
MAWRDDDGVATPVEMMYLVIFCIAAVLFLGFLGRLHTAGVQTTNAAQTAARAASLARNPYEAWVAATDAVDTSSLPRRCRDGADVQLWWQASPTGSWQGGAVTVQVTCVVAYSALAGVWAPGWRSVVVSDTQPVDRYRR